MLAVISFVGFTGLVAFISYMKTRNDKMATSDDYFLGGRSLTAWVIAGSLILTNLSTEHMIGLNADVNESIDCVVVDDVDLLGMPSQIKLFNLYNQIRDESNTFLIVSGQLAPAQLNLRQDLVTRLGWGLVYRVHELMDEEKTKAMKHHATNCGFDLPQEVCDYLLRHERRDLLSLIGTIDALGRYSLANKRQITIPLLRELLQGVS